MKVQVSMERRGRRETSIIELPKHCVACRREIRPKIAGEATIFSKEGLKKFGIGLRCPERDCGRAFTATYGRRQYATPETIHSEERWELDRAGWVSEMTVHL